jgi:hypothetical protein
MTTTMVLGEQRAVIVLYTDQSMTGDGFTRMDSCYEAGSDLGWKRTNIRNASGGGLIGHTILACRY